MKRTLTVVLTVMLALGFAKVSAAELLLEPVTVYAMDKQDRTEHVCQSRAPINDRATYSAAFEEEKQMVIHAAWWNRWTNEKAALAYHWINFGKCRNGSSFERFYSMVINQQLEAG